MQEQSRETGHIDTMSMSHDPLRVNPIRASVARARQLADESLTPQQRAIRDRGRATVDSLVASGFYSLSHRQR